MKGNTSIRLHNEAADRMNKILYKDIMLFYGDRFLFFSRSKGAIF